MNSRPLHEVLDWSWATASQATTCPKKRNVKIEENHRTVLVNDSVEADGRFFLYTLASQFLRDSPQKKRSSTKAKTHEERSFSSSDDDEGYVFWIGCGPATENQIQMALRKILGYHHHCEITNSRLRILPLTVQLSQDLFLHQKQQKQQQSQQEQQEKFESIEKEVDNMDVPREILQKACRQLQRWLQEVNENKTEDENNKSKIGTFPDRHRRRRHCSRVLIVIDDVSALGTLFSETLAYIFILQIRGAIIAQQSKNKEGFFLHQTCLALRSSLGDVDPMAASAISTNYNNAKLSLNESSNNARQWIGAGGDMTQLEYTLESTAVLYRSPPWERKLLELAHIIVDVGPLPSGFSRDIPGRLICTEIESEVISSSDNYDHAEEGGNKGVQEELSRTGHRMLTKVMNYYCKDDGVHVIPL